MVDDKSPTIFGTVYARLFGKSNWSVEDADGPSTCYSEEREELRMKFCPGEAAR
ncbi:MAG: hypothetical protein PHV74_03520 [Dehalococcoidia bacterium]|nr:hypothetical protein [Dehalococcoidia bacterium]